MMKKTKYMREWALYKGEEFIAIGTIDEIAEQTGKSKNLLTWITNPCYKRRVAARDMGENSKAMMMYEVEDDELQ